MHCDCGLLEQLNPPLRPTPAPADSLVERVARAIYEAPNTHEGWRSEARAAIHAVVAWLRARYPQSPEAGAIAFNLDQEASP
jgi:hypothetical protein